MGPWKIDTHNDGMFGQVIPLDQLLKAQETTRSESQTSELFLLSGEKVLKIIEFVDTSSLGGMKELYLKQVVPR